MKLLINICAHDGIVSHYTGVGTIVKRYIEAFSNVLAKTKIEYTMNLFTPEYWKTSFGYSEATKKVHAVMEKTKILMISNGTDGKVNYGTAREWKELSKNTAQSINSFIDETDYDFIITIANDTPYAGLLELLNDNENHKKVWIPHSTVKIHRVDSAIEGSEKMFGERLKWEEDAIGFINKNANSFLGSTGNYIHEHLVSEYSLNPQKAIFVINGEIMSRETVYEETEEMALLFNEIKDYDSMLFSFARAEEYKNLEATMHLGKKLGIKPVVIAQSYFPGQPIIKQYETTARNTGTKLFVDVPFHFPQYILKHYDKPLVMLIPSKKEIVGLIVNETRKLNKANVLVVANDIGGLHEQIADGRDGVLVDLEDISGAADKISKYLDKDKIRDMNTLSQARLKEMYDFEKICTVFLRTLLGGKYDEYFVT
mgnify:CR=1 FL=1